LIKKHKIYLAGHEGLIGSAIHRLLIKKKYQNILIKKKQSLNLKDQHKVNIFFKKHKPDIVILAAGKVGGIQENINNPYKLFNDNLLISTNTINAALNNKVKKFILFGSSCMYPNNINKPIKENLIFKGNLETTSLAYSLSKLASVQMCLTINRQFNCNKFIPIIPNTVYGPNDNFDTLTGHVLPALINKIHLAKINNSNKITLWGNGKIRREFIHADDLAKACLLILKSKISNKHIPINIGVGKDYTIKKLAETISRTVHYKGKIEWNINKPSGTRRKLLDNSKIIKLGWKPDISIEEGIKKTYNWFTNN